MCLYIMISYNVISTVAAAKSEVETTRWEVQNYREFEPSYGDYFMVDIENGIGYLANDFTRRMTVFPVMTGAKRTPTPEKEWLVLEKNIQSDRITFSKSGEFFRMYLDEGEKRTSYGIHGYAYFAKEIKNGRKFLSLGCVLVSDDVLDVIEESFLADNEKMRISTQAEIKLSKFFVDLVR